MPKKNNHESILHNKVPPQNLDAERAALGCMLLSEAARMDAFETIKEEFFYSESHRKIFSAIRTLFEKNEKCDLITVTNQLTQQGVIDEVGGVEYLSEMVEIVPTAANIDEYIKIIWDKYLLRTIIENATDIISEAFSEPEEVDAFLDRVEATIFDIGEKKTKRTIFPLKELIKENIELIGKIHGRQGLVTGVPTGFTDLDKLTTGFHPADFIIIASRPSIGKTAFVCNIALNLNAGPSRFPILMFSLEMSKEQLVQRMLCCEAKINLLKLRQGMLSDEDMGKMLLSAGRLEQVPIFIDDTPSLNTFELRARARRLKASEDIQLIVVDYLQLMKSSRRAENRQQEISEISGSLKALAKELNIPVVAISQLNRAPEQRGTKEPALSDLRESGSLEQDADLVLLLYRNREDEELAKVADVIIAKQRNGPLGRVHLTFREEFARFENYTPRE
ncbi:MAG: replicative DNA helicase [Candidatus Ratteibacteria bacterium]|nr:replicative DNA helicase [Candidatus Ratteibacteria bacterium]